MQSYKDQTGHVNVHHLGTNITALPRIKLLYQCSEDMCNIAGSWIYINYALPWLKHVDYNEKDVPHDQSSATSSCSVLAIHQTPISAIAVTTAINIKGGGGRWERLVYYCGENNLCTPSPREHPSRGVQPSWPVCGDGEALPHPHTPARRAQIPRGRCLKFNLTARFHIRKKGTRTFANLAKKCRICDKNTAFAQFCDKKCQSCNFLDKKVVFAHFRDRTFFGDK